MIVIRYSVAGKLFMQQSCDVVQKWAEVSQSQLKKNKKIWEKEQRVTKEKAAKEVCVHIVYKLVTDCCIREFGICAIYY